MSGSSRIAISWADLPKELLEKISKCLHTETDSRRFRAVCNSWRSSTTPLKKFPLTPLKLPFPFEPSHPNRDGTYLRLTERTVYRLQPPECRDPNFWLVKIEKSKDGKLRVLNPVSDHEINLLHGTQLPKVLNTLDFRVSEVCKAYTLDYVNPRKPKEKYGYKLDKKVAVSVGANDDEYVIMVVDFSDNLWYIKSGDQKWTKVRNIRFTDNFRDIVNYKGQFYGTDKWGYAWLFDSMFEGKQIAYSGRGASKRHLMELFGGELVLVDEVTDEQKRVCTCYGDPEDGCRCGYSRIRFKKTVEEIRISRLDETRKQWVKVEKEFDGIIFAGHDCPFSVSAEEFRKGFKGTRVFYSDPNIYFPTEEKKSHCHDYYDHGYDDDGDGDGDGDGDDDDGYNYWECDCGDSSDEDRGKVDNFVPSDDVKIKFRGLHGHNTGVYDSETGKVGSLLRFPEYAEIFWPPPSWLNRS